MTLTVTLLVIAPAVSTAVSERLRRTDLARAGSEARGWRRARRRGSARPRGSGRSGRAEPGRRGSSPRGGRECKHRADRRDSQGRGHAGGDAGAARGIPRPRRRALSEDLWRRGAGELAQLIAAREVSSREVVE